MRKYNVFIKAGAYELLVFLPGLYAINTSPVYYFIFAVIYFIGMFYFFHEERINKGNTFYLFFSLSVLFVIIYQFFALLFFPGLIKDISVFGMDHLLQIVKILFLSFVMHGVIFFAEIIFNFIRKSK